MYEGLVLSPFVRAASGFRLALLTCVACLFATALLIVVGCERQVAPPLVEVTELAPREVEAGDRLEVHGTGFPQGRIGRVTLQGTIYRPGEAPTRGVTIEAEGTVATPDRLELVVRESLTERFCGRGDRAAHATFQGTVAVSFASNVPNAPPLVGVLHSAKLDVMPSSARASVLEARIAEGGRVLKFAGVVPGTRSPRGLPVEQVQPGSLAAQAGIQVGDVIVAVDGVHVLSLGDVAPASARAMDVLVRHADSGIEETKTLSLLDYSAERVPTEYAPALLLVGIALAVLLLLVLPGPPSLASLELRIASMVRRTTLRELFSALVGSGRHGALSAIASAVLATFALMPYVVGREVDGVVLLGSSSVMLVWSRLAYERGLMASLRTCLRLSVAVVAMFGAITLAIGQVGAIELAEIVRLQGGAPWQFTAARHPSCAMLGVVYAVAVVAILRVRAPEGAKDIPKPIAARAAFLERAGVLSAAGLAVTTFLGGWQLPLLAETRGHLLALLGAALFVAKTWMLAAVLLGASRVMSSLRARDVVGLFLKRLLPGLVLAGLLVAASRRLVPSLAIETAFGATVVALSGLFVVRVAARVRTALGRPEPHASPFL
jgi:NADH-quinone oxidoreductase subunit H